jgi:predicted DNA-binding transcriptional regulator AlpA
LPSAPRSISFSPPRSASTADEGSAAHLSDEGKPAHVTAKEHTMSTTTIGGYAENPILTIDQAAAYLVIPKATLYTWRTRRAGFRPRAVKFGGCLRYRRSDLDARVTDHLESFDDGSEGSDASACHW